MNEGIVNSEEGTGGGARRCEGCLDVGVANCLACIEGTGKGATTEELRESAVGNGQEAVGSGEEVGHG